jgi:hypothetical protein
MKQLLEELGGLTERLSSGTKNLFFVEEKAE